MQKGLDECEKKRDLCKLAYTASLVCGDSGATGLEASIGLLKYPNSKIKLPFLRTPW